MPHKKASDTKPTIASAALENSAGANMNPCKIKNKKAYKK
jgi:hypothetical protein